MMGSAFVDNDKFRSIKIVFICRFSSPTSRFRGPTGHTYLPASCNVSVLSNMRSLYSIGKRARPARKQSSWSIKLESDFTQIHSMKVDSTIFIKKMHCYKKLAFLRQLFCPYISFRVFVRMNSETRNTCPTGSHFGLLPDKIGADNGRSGVFTCQKFFVLPETQSKKAKLFVLCDLFLVST